VTHERRLVDVADLLDDFLAWTSGLGVKRDVLLVQLPPSLGFVAATAEQFFGTLRERYDGNVVCEPRHASWFGEPPDALLRRYHVARVAADPVVSGGTPEPGGWPGLCYRRLHGSPIVYRSAYGSEELDALALRMRSATAPQWCIFDNTAAGAAAADALDLLARLSRAGSGSDQRPE
jgi:uncharacterized protein YecE (DUF72 family)